MKIHSVIISILIISMIVIGAIEYLNALSDGYGSTVDLTGLNGTMNRLEEQQRASQDLSDDVTGFTLKGDITDIYLVPYQMISIGWKVGKNFFSSWLTVETMVKETVEGVSDSGIDIPSWFTDTVISILITMLVAIVIYAFFKWKFES